MSANISTRNFFVSLFLLLALCLFSTAHAAIKGRVVDRNTGNALAGATITLGTIATKSDENGEFSFPNGREGDELTISYVGYLARTVTFHGKSDMSYGLEQTEQQLDDILVTAERSDRTVARTPRTAYRTSASDIEHAGAQTATDALRTLPGVAMTDAGTFRARPVIRGLYGSRLLVLVDGERQNDQREVSDFAGVSLSLLDVNDIDRVEVVSGSTSPLYGSDAMGGVVNVITKHPGFSATLRPSGSYTGRYSSTDQQQNHRLEFGVENRDWYLSGASMWRQTERNYRPPNGWQTESGYGIFNQTAYDKIAARSGRSFGDRGLVNTGAELSNLDVRLGARLDSQSRLEASASNFQADNVGYPGVPNDSTPFYFYYPQHDRHSGSLSFVHDNADGLFGRFESKLYVQQVEKLFLTDFLGSLRIPTGPGGPTIVPQTAASRTTVTKVGLNIQQQLGHSDTENALVGIEGWTEKYRGKVSEVTLLDFSSPGPPDMLQTDEKASVPNSRWNSIGLFGRYHTALGPFAVETGARWDLFRVTALATSGYVDSLGAALTSSNDNYSALTGSLGFMLPVSAGVSAYTSVGSAYRVPNSVERFFYGQQEGRNIRPNPSIKPERSYSFEAGFKGIQPSLSYSLIGFYNSYENFIQLRSPGANVWQYQNVQNATILGSELLVEGRLPVGIYANIGLSYQRGDSKADGDKQPLFVAPFTTTITTGWRDRKQVTFVEASIRRLEKQTRVSNSTALDDVPTNGFTVVNLAGGVSLFEQIRATLTLNNLFDQLYSEPFNARGPDNPIPEPGRNLVVSLTANLF